MQVTVLSRHAREQMHEAALGILEEPGLQVESPALAAQLADLGLPFAAKDRVRIPRARVLQALESAPREVRLGARSPEKQAVLNGTRTYVTTDGCGSNTLDLETNRVRPASLADVVASARLVDGLPNTDIYWSMVSAQDVEPANRVARGFLAALQNTVKPVQVVDAGTPAEAETLARMARQIRSAGVVHGPPVSMVSAVVTPLRLDPGGTEAALVFARESLPVVCGSMPISGVTSPATPAGTVMLAHAEALAFVTILQTAHPGCPVVYCSFPTFGDARTGSANYADPRHDWVGCAATELGRSTGLPCFTSSSLFSLARVPDLCSWGGMLATSTLLCFEQLLIDDEIMGDRKIRARAQDASAESLALDVLRKVGPGGHFLAQRHTAQHVKQFGGLRFSESDAEMIGAPAQGEAPARQRAREEARRRIRCHRAEPLPEALEAALLAIAERGAPGEAG
ncbi:MAG TPA: trimethylamine methyltransferase family protein [Myxococcota bacterium]